MSEINRADINGIDPFSGWIIALIGGRTLLGKFDAGYLDPVYDFGVQVQPAAGGLQRHFVVIPFLWLSSIEKLRIPVDCTRVIVSELSREEKHNILKSVGQADDLVRKMRAADSGILIASAVPVKP